MERLFDLLTELLVDIWALRQDEPHVAQKGRSRITTGKKNVQKLVPKSFLILGRLGEFMQEDVLFLLVNALFLKVLDLLSVGDGFVDKLINVFLTDADSFVALPVFVYVACNSQSRAQRDSMLGIVERGGKCVIYSADF